MARAVAAGLAKVDAICFAGAQCPEVARLREIATRYGYARVARYATAVQDYAERVLRRTIETIPDGEYDFEDALDNDGFSDAPVRIRARIRIAGDSAEVDFTGTDAKTGAPTRLIGALVSQNGRTWFYKLMGDKAVVAQQKDSFTKFIQSANYANAR